MDRRRVSADGVEDTRTVRCGMDEQAIAKRIAKSVMAARIGKDWQRLPKGGYKLRWYARGLGATQFRVVEEYASDIRAMASKDMSAMKELLMGRPADVDVVVYPSGGSIEIGAMAFVTPFEPDEFPMFLERRGFDEE